MSRSSPSSSSLGWQEVVASASGRCHRRRQPGDAGEDAPIVVILRSPLAVGRRDAPLILRQAVVVRECSRARRRQQEYIVGLEVRLPCGIADSLFQVAGSGRERPRPVQGSTPCRAPARARRRPVRLRAWRYGVTSPKLADHSASEGVPSRPRARNRHRHRRAGGRWHTASSGSLIHPPRTGPPPGAPAVSRSITDGEYQPFGLYNPRIQFMMPGTRIAPCEAVAPVPSTRLRSLRAGGAGPSPRKRSRP